MTYSYNLKDTQKEERAKELRKFWTVSKVLKDLYTLHEISTKVGIGASNLSAYFSGAKHPSAKTIKKLYTAFDTDIKKMLSTPIPYSSKNEQLDQVVEEPVLYTASKRSKDINGELIHMLMVNNERLLTLHEKMSQHLATLAETTARLVDNNSQLVASNTNLINKLYEK